MKALLPEVQFHQGLKFYNIGKNVSQVTAGALSCNTIYKFILFSCRISIDCDLMEPFNLGLWPLMAVIAMFLTLSIFRPQLVVNYLEYIELFHT